MRRLASIELKLYTFSFFDRYIVIYPIYGLMFADAGVSPARIAIVLMSWSASAFLFTIPAGILSDRFARKKVLLIAITSRIFSLLLWIIFNNFYGFLAGFILWGLKDALTSATLRAFVYDELGGGKNSQLYTKLIGKMSAIGLTGTVLAGFSAGLLAHLGYYKLLFLSIIALVVSWAAILLLPNATKASATVTETHPQIFKRAFLAVVKNPPLLYVIFYLSIVAGMGATDEFFNLFLREKGMSNATVAFSIGVIFAFGACGSWFAHRFTKRLSMVNLALFCWPALLFVSSLFPKYAAALALCLYSFFFYVVAVISNSLLQKYAADKQRSTIVSIGGFFSELLSIVCFGIVGFGASRAGYAFGFKLAALVTATMTLLLALYYKQKRITLN